MITPYFDARRRSPHTWAEAYYQPVAGRLIAFPAWLVHSTHPNMAGAGSESAQSGARDGTTRDDPAEGGEDGGLAGERISVSFNFGQRRRDIDPAAAPPSQVVRADLLARRQ